MQRPLAALSLSLSLSLLFSLSLSLQYRDDRQAGEDEDGAIAKKQLLRLTPSDLPRAYT